MLDRLDIQTTSHLNEIMGDLRYKRFGDANLGDVQRNIVNILVWLAKMDKTRGNKKIYESYPDDTSGYDRPLIPTLITDNCNFQVIFFLELCDEVDHLWIWPGLGKHKLYKCLP